MGQDFINGLWKVVRSNPASFNHALNGIFRLQASFSPTMEAAKEAASIVNYSLRTKTVLRETNLFYRDETKTFKEFLNI